MYLTEAELEHAGLRRWGRNVCIDSTVQLFNPQEIVIGDNVRIDCFCLLSAGSDGIALGSHIHIGAGSYFFGTGGAITLEDFSGVSPRVMLFTASDDFTEGYLRGPTIAMPYRKVVRGPICLKRNAGVGAGSVVLPGVVLGVNSMVGAMSVVEKSVPENSIFVARTQPRLISGVRDPDLAERLMHEWNEAWDEEHGQSHP